MNCTICNQRIILIPSGEERAAKDISGRTADQYAALFTTHSTCALKQRAEETTALMERLRNERQSKT